MTSLHPSPIESQVSPQTIPSIKPLETVSKKPPTHVRSIFASTFLTIFLAEMGDKTQLSTLLISAESRSPWIVFLGSALALIATSLLGVSIGYWIARRLSPKTLDLAVAILLLFITGLLLGDVINS
jgi:putative Ca2+/H+ antiporter (TMEM165/GDT1 family)